MVVSRRPEEIKQAYQALREKEALIEADVSQLKDRVVEWKERYNEACTQLEEVQTAIKSLDTNIPDDAPVEVDPNANV
jgi:chromosome segregation ATPase